MDDFFVICFLINFAMSDQDVTIDGGRINEPKENVLRRLKRKIFTRLLGVPDRCFEEYVAAKDGFKEARLEHKERIDTNKQTRKNLLREKAEQAAAEAETERSIQLEGLSVTESGELSKSIQETCAKLDEATMALGRAQAEFRLAIREGILWRIGISKH